MARVQKAPAAEPALNSSPPFPVEGKYVYCIIESESARDFGRIGIGDRSDSVHTIRFGDLAAVASSAPMVIYDPTRENVLAHEKVNEAVMKEFTVIPMSFGTLFRTDEDVIEFLKHTSGALRDVLRKMNAKIEFGLKVNWDTDAILQEIERERDDIRLLKAELNSKQLTSTYFARMQLGRLVEQAMNAKAEAYVSAIYEALRDYAVASRQNKVIGEKMILNAAFLVEREKTARFEARIQEIAQQYEGRLRFLFTGPWPPYNFVNIRLKLERGAAIA